MNFLVIRTMLIGWVLLLVAGCGGDGLSFDTYWSDGNYRLIAVDDRGQMSLIHSELPASNVVGPTVFAIGADEKYIVAAQHPSKNAFGDFDRSITNYFIVERTRISTSDSPKLIRGPLSEDEFERFSKKLLLPSFSKTFDDLK